MVNRLRWTNGAKLCTVPENPVTLENTPMLIRLYTMEPVMVHAASADSVTVDTDSDGWQDRLSASEISAVEAAAQIGDVITMGCMVAQPIRNLEPLEGGE